MSPPIEPMPKAPDPKGILHDEDTLRVCLAEAQARYSERNPKSRLHHEESCQYLPGGNTRSSIFSNPFPLTLASAHTCKLKTLDGHEYADFLGEYTAGIFGHSNPIIKKAVSDALDKGWSFGGTNVYEKELAKAVCERFAPTVEMVRFTNSGTEANMVAIAAAMAFTKRKKILVFHKGYHGSTISARVPAGEGKQSINLPHEFIIAPYNDERGTSHIISSLPKSSLAAVIVEPTLGSGGCFPAHPSFLHFLRETATKHSALLIFDEVMTSRLAYGGMQKKLNIRPDLMTLGKWVAGGMSFGAFGGRRDIMEMFDPRKEQLEHAGTFNNNAISMAAGIAAHKILSVSALEGLNEFGEVMRSKVNDELWKSAVIREQHIVPTAPAMPSQYPTSLQPSNPPAMYATGTGSLMTVHFAGPFQSLLLPLFWHHMLEHDIYLAQRGFIALSLEIQGEHVEAFVKALGEFVDRYEEWLVPAG